MMNKRGSVFRVTSGIFGSILFLLGLFFLNQENFIQATIFGLIGLLLMTISMLPFAKA